MRYCIFLGNNFEDVEAVTQIDVLKRAGVQVDIYGVGAAAIKSRSSIIYQTDKIFNKETDVDVSSYNGILIPGGPGVKELVKNDELIRLIAKFYDAGKTVFAICAGPRLLDKAGVLKGKRYTSYPGEEIVDGTRVNEKVVVDGTVITSQGVGTSLDAALKLVELFVSPEEAENQAKKVLFYGEIA